jgi:4-hydroxyphenylpyruvate dioxygenase
MKTSIVTVSIGSDLKQKLEVIVKARFDGVEIFGNEFLTYDESPRAAPGQERAWVASSERLI